METSFHRPYRRLIGCPLSQGNLSKVASPGLSVWQESSTDFVHHTEAGIDVNDVQ